MSCILSVTHKHKQLRTRKDLYVHMHVYVLAKIQNIHKHMFNVIACVSRINFAPLCLQSNHNNNKAQHTSSTFPI